MRALLLLLMSCLAASAQSQPGSMSLAIVDAVPDYPDDRPVVFRIRLTNTGDADLTDESAPREYPNARQFVADLIDPGFHRHRCDLMNGQYDTIESGLEIRVAPGATIDVPVVLPNPGPGQWTMTVEMPLDSWWPQARSEQVHLTVASSADARQGYDDRFVEKLRGGDDFYALLLERGTIGRLAGDDERTSSHELLYGPEVLPQAVALLTSGDIAVALATASSLCGAAPERWPDTTGAALLASHHRWSGYVIDFSLARIAVKAGGPDSRRLLEELRGDARPELAKLAAEGLARLGSAP